LDSQEIYELRHTTLRSGALDEYLREARKPAGEGKTLCVLSGLIGYPPEEVVRMTRYPGIDAWQQAQVNASVTDLAEKEEVRLMRSISSRPKSSVPPEDRRAVYGYRRFFIRPGDLEELVHDSEDGVWPRIESQGACILGLWATVAATDPLEVMMLTGYHSASHWQETRQNRDMPEDMAQQLWETSRRLRARRTELAIRNLVCLMEAVEVVPEG